MISTLVIVSLLSKYLAKEYLVTPGSSGFAAIHVPMVLGKDMVWKHGTNFTKAHLVDVKQYAATKVQVCIHVKERPGKQTCFLKEEEFYSWGRINPISRPCQCPKNEVCTFKIAKVVKGYTFMAVFEPYNFDWIHRLKPSIPAPLSYAQVASIDKDCNFSFKGPANKTLLFKALYWNIVLSVASIPDLKFSLLFPVVTPNGELDGVYKIGAPPRYSNWNGFQ